MHCTPLYNETRTVIIRKLTPDQHNSMIAEGKIIAFRMRNGKWAAAVVFTPRQSPKYTLGIGGGAQISKTEMLLNAETSESARKYGVNCYGAEDEMIVGNFVDHAKSKLEAWPEVHDTKAIVVSAGKVYRPHAT